MKEKIKFNAISIDWSYGGIMSFTIKVSTESNISISWGDGHKNTHNFINSLSNTFRHDYYPNKIIPPDSGAKYLVEISSDDPDCRIIGFNLYPLDMEANDLNITNCPELEELDYHGYIQEVPSHALDLSHNTALKYLNCEKNGYTSLDLSNNTALEVLYCNNNRLSHLSLTGNFALKKLNCEYNEMKQLFISSYAPQLIEAEIEEGNQIDEVTVIQIWELVEENNFEKL